MQTMYTVYWESGIGGERVSDRFKDFCRYGDAWRFARLLWDMGYEGVSVDEN